MAKKIKDLSILTVGHIIQGIILLCSVRLMTFYLSPDEVGRYFLFYTTIFFFFSFFISPAGTFFQRKILEWHDQNQGRRCLIRIYVYLGIISLFAACLIPLFQNYFSFNLGLAGWRLASLVFLIIFFQYLNVFFCDWLNIFQKRLVYVCCSAGAIAVGLLCSVYFASHFSPRAESWLWGQVVGHISMTVISGFFIIKFIGLRDNDDFQGDSEKDVLKYFVGFAWPIALASVVMWFQTQSYRFLFEYMNGVYILGLFVVGFNVSSRLMGKVSVLFTTFYHPFFFKEITNASKEVRIDAWQKYASVYIPALVLVVVYIACGAQLLTNIFIDPQFQTVAALTIGFGVLTMFFLELGSVYKMVGISELNMKGLLMPHFFGALCVLLGLIIFSSWLGPFLGAGFALLAGAIITCIFLRIEMKKVLPVRFPQEIVKKSGFLAIPIMVLFMIQEHFVPIPSILQSIFILLGVGVYLVGAQIFLARKWLFH